MGGSFSSPTKFPETAGAVEPIDGASSSPLEAESQKSERNPKGAEEKGEEEEEEGECGFCLFMKAGNCKEEFIEWQKCVKEGSECSEVSAAMFKCMEANKDFYGAILDAKDKLDEEGTTDAKDSEKKKEGSKGEGSEPEQNRNGVSFLIDVEPFLVAC